MSLSLKILGSVRDYKQNGFLATEKMDSFSY